MIKANLLQSRGRSFSRKRTLSEVFSASAEEGVTEADKKDTFRIVTRSVKQEKDEEE